MNLPATCKRSMTCPGSTRRWSCRPQNATGDWQRVGNGVAGRRERAKPFPRRLKITPPWPTPSKTETPPVSIPRWRITAHRSFRTFPRALAKARAEVFFNQMQPFYNAMVIYVLAGLLAIFSWFNLSETLRRSAVWLIALAFFIHTTGLIYRIVLQGRPPVTNLYSSAIFIGWGAVVLGLILEKFHRNGIGAVVSAGMGFITLVIAQNLAVDGDTMEMMRAVLDTNFWLATHVVVVTPVTPARSWRVFLR